MNQTQNFFSIEGHTALVTGCSRGIGRAMAVGLAEAPSNESGENAAAHIVITIVR